jgi:hypothetical protein
MSSIRMPVPTRQSDIRHAHSERRQGEERHRGPARALFGLDQTRMLYGDAQAALSQLIHAIKAAG